MHRLPGKHRQQRFNTHSGATVMAHDGKLVLISLFNPTSPTRCSPLAARLRHKRIVVVVAEAAVIVASAELQARTSSNIARHGS